MEGIVIKSKPEHFKDFIAYQKIITDKDLKDDDLKLYCIMEQLRDNKITLQKAYELCTQEGLFKTEWADIYERFNQIWDKYYK